MRNSVALFMSVGAAGLIGLASPGARVPDMTATPAQASGLVYVSGITGHLPGTTDFPEGIAAQTRQALENLDAALREKGADLSRVASTNVFLTDIVLDAWETRKPMGLETWAAALNSPPAKFQTIDGLSLKFSRVFSVAVDSTLTALS